MNLREICFLLLFFGFVAVGLAREVPITILDTCDLHGNVLPTESYEGRTNLGGIARCATMIRRVREREKNVLLVDAGDTTQGAAIGYLTDGQVMVKTLNHLRYDAWVWGNHEFDWGLEKLATCAQKSEVPILNANIRKDEGGRMRDEGPAERILSRIKPYRLLEIDGVKTAIIGLNTPGIPNWSRPRLIEGLKLEDSVETLTRLVPALREAGAQVLLLVCHQGFREQGDDHANQINAIARNFPELDVIIGGHTHRHFPEFKVSNVLYCQAGYFGIYLGRVDLVFDTEKRRVTRRKSTTMLMDETVPLDPDLLKLVAREIDTTEKLLHTTIGEARESFGLSGGPRKETAIHTLICESIAGALADRDVHVDAVLHGILERRGTLARGPVTVADVWRIVPYENTIGVAELTPAQFSEILDENAGAYGKREFRGIFGLWWLFDPAARQGARVLQLLRPDRTPLQPDECLHVAFNSYDLASGGLRWKKLREIVDKPETKLVEYDFQTRQAVIDYIRKRGVIEPHVQNWWRAEKGKGGGD
jgi:2',3'-cyclic-nucleotide 2'-phosphodiesterase (5'-nucleotidase family)